ncbi:DUF624 domain-containing protein [Actinoplanes sichuanensis]|uniref:Uncharacterized protein n=1 Tax=Actinoplanes sichuanensis TaxID=512349 RepID=A0ABW4A7G2_9ACTN|nr:hypothetical protein [Actinoplanes sichuanensis]BEL03497.1 DUF624 domain-containing protein [Actinoplanes sichuanensis]
MLGERFGTGLLSRAAALIYTLLAVQLLVLVTAGPGLVLLVFLERDVSNLPLAALGGLPAGPALSAAIYALDRRRLDLTDLHPGTAFVRGYRLNAVGALKVWGLWLLVVTPNLVDPGVPQLIVIAGATLWMLNALVVTSLFVFRFRDVARLSAYLLIRSFGVTVSNACLIVVALAVVWLWSEAALALAMSLLVLMLLSNARPLVEVVRKEFVA